MPKGAIAACAWRSPPCSLSGSLLALSIILAATLQILPHDFHGVVAVFEGNFAPTFQARQIHGLLSVPLQFSVKDLIGDRGFSLAGGFGIEEGVEIRVAIRIEIRHNITKNKQHSQKREMKREETDEESIPKPIKQGGGPPNYAATPMSQATKEK